jgi:hypothetical protein
MADRESVWRAVSGLRPEEVMDASTLLKGGFEWNSFPLLACHYAAEAEVFVPVVTSSLPRMRAFLLATSEDQRARLTLPRGVLSGVELPVTSKYTASAASG